MSYTPTVDGRVCTVDESDERLAIGTIADLLGGTEHHAEPLDVCTRYDFDRLLAAVAFCEVIDRRPEVYRSSHPVMLGDRWSIYVPTRFAEDAR